ncbi:MAG TPA: excinuclease ABC subunit UvrC, partial [Clostridia bacterium]
MFDIKEELKKLPEKPGVYIMKDETGSIIYIGKAVILKNRVKQYFGKTAKPPKVAAMVQRIREFEYIVTDSELEALILECNLIKKHKPKFNILLKDDKNYPYIKVTMNEEYPRIIMTRKMEKDGARYFGPYSNVTAVRDTIGLLKRLFPIKTCNKVFPRDIGKERPCLNYHIYQCLGPCRGDVGKEEYQSLMKDICSFLGGKQEGIVKRLDQQMNEASERLEFEKAAGIRDKIASLRHIAEKQKIISATMEDQDIIAFARSNTDSCVQVFFIRSGKLIGREHFMLEDVGESDDSEIMTSFIKQFYSAAAFIPSEIVIKEDIDELNI